MEVPSTPAMTTAPSGEPSLNTPTPSGIHSFNTTPSSGAHSIYTPGVLQFTTFCNTVTCLGGTVGNVVVMLSSKKLRRNYHTAFMVNLALCLIPLCCYTLPMMVAKVVQHHEASRILTPTTMWIVYMSHGFLHQVHMLTICALALNRFVALRLPVLFRQVMRPSVVALQLLLIWIYSAILWLPLNLIDADFNPDVIMIKPRNKKIMKLHIIFAYFLPLSVTIICYFLICVKVRYGKSVVDGGRPRGETSCRRWEEQASRSVFVIFIILVVCSLPHTIIHLMDCVCPDAWIIIHTLLWLQFCLDPIVYVVVSEEYLKGFLQCLPRSLASSDDHTKSTGNPAVS